MPITRNEFSIKARAALSHIEDAKRHLETADELCAALLRIKPKNMREAHVLTELIARKLLLCDRTSAISASLDPDFTKSFVQESGDVRRRLTGTDFAARIREARMNKGLSRPELASILGYTRTAIYSWEEGITRPRASHLPHVASVLGVSVQDLLVGEEA